MNINNFSRTDQYVRCLLYSKISFPEIICNSVGDGAQGLVSAKLTQAPPSTTGLYHKPLEHILTSILIKLNCHLDELQDTCRGD